MASGVSARAAFLGKDPDWCEARGVAEDDITESFDRVPVGLNGQTQELGTGRHHDLSTEVSRARLEGLDVALAVEDALAEL